MFIPIALTAFFVMVTATNEVFDELSFEVNHKNCGNRSVWELIDYKDIRITPVNSDGSKALRSHTDSCVAIFHHAYNADGSFMKFDVCMHLVSRNSGVEILVFDDFEDSVPTARHVYKKSSKGFIPGWSTIEVPVTKDTKGYIMILGHTISAETILIGSIKYITLLNSDTHTGVEVNVRYDLNYKNTQFSDEDENKNIDYKNEKLFIFNHRDNEDKVEEGSGNEEGSGDNSITEETYKSTTDINNISDTDVEEYNNGTESPLPELEDTEKSDTWNTLTISLVVIGAVVGVGGIAYGSYYLGKRSMVTHQEPFNIDDIEPPIRIPRARSFYQESI